MVSNLGKKAIASVSLANAVFFILIIFGLGISTSISSLISSVDAKNNYRKGSMILIHSIILNFVLSIIMYGLTYIFFFIFPYLNQPEEIKKETISFLKILSISFIPWMIFEVFRKFSEGLSLVYPSLIVTWISTIMNIILNYSLINGLLGFPKLGIIGVAYATLISRLSMLIFIIPILLKYKKIRKYFIHIKYFYFQKKYIKQILKIGIPSGLHMLFEVGAFAISSFISGKCGLKVLAAHQIVINLVSSTFIIITGFSLIATIRIGNQFALKNYFKIKEIGTSIIIMGSIFMLICSFLLFFFKNYIPYIYIKKNDYEMILIIKKMIIVASIFQLFDGLQGIISGILRGLQDVKIPMCIIFFSYWIIGIPISWYLSKKIGGHGIWIGLGIGLTISSVLLFIRYKIIIKKLILLEK
ncbi:MATE family efflux transporter [Blattabacterium cuenoti]|uniref:MATE family efflux transporter n=1 Tax=Blattabacterium cuenoti TaxID=1653831 RepID=UPI001EE9E390|nr:MATE family efflux transporter [Blattabacterium cuenoti]